MKDEILARLAPQKIDLLTKLIEGYDHLGIVSTLDPRTGLVVIRVTGDTCPEIMEILANLPFPLEILPDKRV